MEGRKGGGEGGGEEGRRGGEGKEWKGVDILAMMSCTMIHTRSLAGSTDSNLNTTPPSAIKRQAWIYVR